MHGISSGGRIGRPWAASVLGVLGVIAMTLVGFVVGGTPAFAARQVVASAIGLGKLPGLQESIAVGVNAAGVVVGNSFNYEASGAQATLWRPTPAGGYDVVDLGALIPGEDSFANAIAANGVVAGSRESSAHSQAVIWKPDGRGGYTVQDLEGLPISGGVSNANAIAPDGVVVGSVGDGATYTHAAAWFPRDGAAGYELVDLGTLPNPWAPVSYASGVNAVGLIVGSAYDSSYGIQAMIWRRAERGGFSMQTLPRFSDGPNGYSGASGVNASGVIVGSSAGHNVVWRPAGQGTYRVTDIATPAGSSGGGVTAISPTGVIVGRWDQSGGAIERAASWRPDGHGGYAFIDVGTLRPDDVLAFATAVSATGLVVGYSGANPWEVRGEATLWRLSQ